MKTKIIIVNLLLFTCIKLNADCGENASFITTFTNVYLKHNSFLFVKGIKLYDYHHGIKIKILDNYSNFEVNDTITVWYCNPAQHLECNAWDYQETYEVKDTLICIVKPTDFWGNVIYCDTCPNNEDSLHIEKEGDYQVIACSPSIIKYSNDKVSGWIFDIYKDTTISYAEFENIIANKTKLYRETPSEKTIKIFPNPTRNEIQISNFNKDPIKKLELFDNYGRLLDTKYNSDNKSLIIYSLENKKNGQYYIRIIYDKHIVIKKVIKS